ncbi:hypothetical protein IscW_ISCW009872 [Ixodes scapularis]|uniref:Uncharacterized protein n=1 Tax=Ixodes scapularis TaxID=6945 RepID=B7Q3J1_IXOSC|nr:hypothetical protein IscW_ISCW009872 [Ixodes scapularis]|eukprot:XP_002411289.1 hypothetical protein IscW_ISCW009872 [Ixodes scapularis]
MSSGGGGAHAEQAIDEADAEEVVEEAVSTIKKISDPEPKREVDLTAPESSLKVADAPPAALTTEKSCETTTKKTVTTKAERPTRTQEKHAGNELHMAAASVQSMKRSQ